MTSPWYMHVDLGAPEGDYTGYFVSDPADDDFAGYEAGDIVTLITGSPDFVVTNVCDECGDVHVTWYDDVGGLQFAMLPEEVLVYA